MIFFIINSFFWYLEESDCCWLVCVARAGRLVGSSPACPAPPPADGVDWRLTGPLLHPPPTASSPRRRRVSGEVGAEPAPAAKNGNSGATSEDTLDLRVEVREGEGACKGDWEAGEGG